MDNKKGVDIGDLLYAYTFTEKPEKKSFYNHMHSMYEILFIINGNVDFVINNIKYKLNKYDFILIPPSEYHFVLVDSDETYERYVINFNEKNIDKALLNECFNTFKILNFKDNVPIKDALKNFTTYADCFKGEKLNLGIYSLMTQILLNVTILKTTALSCEDITAQNTSYFTPVLQQVINYINNNFYNIISLESLSQHFFISKSHLMHLFKTEMGTPIMNYIRNKQILYAQTLLKAGEKPTQVAVKCGFENYTTFYRAYLRYIKQSPKEEKHL